MRCLGLRPSSRSWSTAQVRETAFPYSAQHSQFVYRAINDRLTKKMTSFHGFRADEIDISPGDIIHMNRSSSVVLDYMWSSTHKDYPSHSDIAISVSDTTIQAIGGNVGTAPGQIAIKSFKKKGGVWTNGGQTITTVIRSFLP
jgi:hypothetical protein